MKEMKLLIGWITVMMLMSLIMANSSSAYDRTGQWQSPFPDSGSTGAPHDSLTLDRVLYYVGQTNYGLVSAGYRKESAAGLLRQAGAWSNPELEFEAEEFSGNLPGFSQSEWSLSVTQELELWGQRSARKAVSETEEEQIRLDAEMMVFDIYIDAKSRFFEAVHAQNQLDLVKQAEALVSEMVEVLRDRVERGASLVAELHLAELELIRIQIEAEEAAGEAATAQKLLASMWQNHGDLPPVISRQDMIHLPELDELVGLIDNSREIIHRKTGMTRLQAEFAQSMADARPSLALSAGFKRIEAEDINTFTFGLSLPLPLHNSNRGQQAAIQSQMRAEEVDVAQEAQKVKAEIETIYRRLEQLIALFDVLDQLAVPESEYAFRLLQEAYSSGKLPYTALLDAKRTLLDLRKEQNNTMFEFQKRIIDLEGILGIRLENISTQ
jgi:cobalt-zinc-cadmium efflux system outer membrane protein